MKNLITIRFLTNNEKEAKEIYIKINEQLNELTTNYFETNIIYNSL